ncbi:actin-binding protein anillin-like isoform X1 [Sinocyclocheilus anshuiensis]|uniref:actin-binding protein anillin-like isoform X1 n=1 Tax=Sinocyclocheilus anshuiensis TaxID=1608454 RepID=UPI0007B99E2C|nr:PREDICTED: actin-binding protein anillin-like isoform X1 [Sinocyclocheilus anshuiensis]
MENQKRPRDPLEENTSASCELENVLKKRRLAAGGEENLYPKKSPARTHLRLAELEVKPDTPAIASIRSRVQQLSQRRDGGTGLVQRCLSDPGSEGCTVSMSSRICHIGEGEFSSRLQRFKARTPLNSPSSSTPCTRNLSSFVHGIQKQLNTAVTPSSKEASRIRQARENELRQLKVQPVAENMWLKRSLSDSSLTERASPSTSSPWVYRKNRKLQWPPLQPGSDELKETEFSSCELDSKVFDGSLNTTPPCSVDIRFPNEELYTSTEPGTLNTSAQIDKMFDDVLQHADNEAEGEDGNKEEEVKKDESNSSETEKEDKTESDTAEKKDKQEPVTVTLNEDPLDQSEMCEESEETPEASSSTDKDKELQSIDDGEGEMKEEKESGTMSDEDFLTLPPSCIISPLSKSVEAVVTPLKIEITVSEPSVQPPSPEEMTASPADSVPPLYSIDAYRSQRKIHPPSTESLTPGVQKQVQEKTCSKKPINIKERIKALNEEAAKLQTIITQTLQALSCCSDEEHGKGSQQEAEAEKLLLVSSEKRAALLTEVSRLREGESDEPDSQNAPLQPCRGTVSISSIQLPLKVEFVCSARTGRPTHYFFVLIRYGPCNIVATPLATAADAQNGDTITFPTSIILQSIRSSFEIDVEVYSLSSTRSNTCSMNAQQFRSSTKSRVTPKKILHSITKSNQSVTSATLPGLSAQRSSNFTLVGSHKITLNSLGQSKFPLDKVPFLSPLEGHIYLRLHSEGHASVQHQGFLTMFEDVSGFGAWQRFYFLLEGGHLLYWNYPNEMGNKPADGSLSLFGFCSVRPVERECCARPHTFELVETNTLQQEHSQTLKKCWFSADTREERSDWMEKLNQTLLDSVTWNRTPVSNDNRASTSSNTGNSRESIL